MKKKLKLTTQVFGYGFKKLLLIMKLTLLLTIFGLLPLTASVYSQNGFYSISANNQSFKEVLDQIESKGQYHFFYNDNFIDLEKKVNLEIAQSDIKTVLNRLFEGSNATYKLMNDNLIVIAPKMIIQQTKISGTITDVSTNEPLPGVNIRVEGTTIGTTTDIDGKYSIEVPGQDAVLVFSFIGYLTETVTVGGQSIIDVTLASDIKKLEEVVVVGYGTQKKATVSGSISTVKGKDLVASPSINVASSLVGRMSGVVSVTSSGEPGDDTPTILIRGSNTFTNSTDNNTGPLYVIDGIANRSMAQLDQSDIESITVLKDASAAIYGAQAANGVILITTKRGNIGKPEIKVTFNQAYNQPTRLPEMADAPTYATMLNEISYYANAANGKNHVYSDEEIQKFSDGSDPWHYPNTDWYDATIKKFSQQRYGNISVSGGTENMKYFVGLGTKYQDGIYKKSATYYKQYNFRSNLDGKVTKNIDFGIDLSGRMEDRNYSSISESNIFQMLVRGKPTYPAYWPNGTPGPDLEYGYNPVVICTDATGYNRTKTYVFESNLKLKANIPWVKGLSVTGNLAIDKKLANAKTFQKPWYTYSWNGTSYDENGDPVLVKTSYITDPNLTQSLNDDQSITANLLVNYNVKFGVHELSLLAGVERNQGKYSNFSAYRRYFVSDVIDELFAGGDNEKTNGGSSSETARLNYFGRVNYNYKQKYLAEFLWRYDGSYIFPENSRYGFFPGVSLAYRISEEDFWNKSIIQNLKIRGSWGQTGNDRVNPYQYLAAYEYSTSWSPSGTNPKYYIFDDNQANQMLEESVVPNSTITWEVANQSNIGFEATTLHNKLSVEFDYFYNLRSEILVTRNASLPVTTGINAPDENIGKVINQGVELTLGYNNEMSNGLHYNVTFTGSYSYNKIKFWDEVPGAPEWQVSTGHPMNTSLYYKAIGIFHNQEEIDAYPHWTGARPGDIKFEDVKDDGIINADDRVRIDKSSTPKFTAGVNVNLQYKGFDLSMLVQGAAGAMVYISGLDYSGEVGNFYKEFADNRWTEENPNADYPRTWNRTAEYWMSNQNTFFLRSNDYIRLKNIEIGYNLSKKITNVMQISGLRIAISGANLVTIDKFKILDPETNGARSYPLNRTISGNITLTF